MKVCPKCYEEVRNDSIVFCPKCSTRMESPAAVAEIIAAKEKPKRGKWVIVLCVLLGLAAISNFISGINLASKTPNEYYSMVSGQSANLTEIEMFAEKAASIDNTLGYTSIILACVGAAAIIGLVLRRKIGAYLVYVYLGLAIVLQLAQYILVKGMIDDLGITTNYPFPFGIVLFYGGMLATNISYFSRVMSNSYK